MLYGAENGIADIGGREVVAEFAAGNALLDDFEQDAVELLHQAVGLAVEVFFRVPDFQQNDPGEDAVVGIALDGGPDDLSQLVDGPVDALQIALDLHEKMLVMLLEDVVQKIALILEILVDQPFGDPGGGCDVRDGQRFEGPLIEQGAHGLDDLQFAGRDDDFCFFH